MTAKEYLNRYRKINAYIDCKLEQVTQLRAIASRVSPARGAGQSGGMSDRVGYTVAKIVDLEHKIDREVDKLVEVRKEIITTISAVDNEDIRVVLEYRYINGWSWRKIAAKMHYSEDHVTCYLHRKALKEIDKIRKVNGS